MDSKKRSNGATVPPSRPPLAHSKKEACRELGGICVRHLDNLINNGELVARKIGRRKVVLHSSIIAFLRRDHPGEHPSREQ
jgi:hypothetical protein